MGTRKPEVDALLAQSPWSEAFAALRDIVLSLALEETVKWGQPCYTFEGRNIVLMHGFKDYCALLFFKGALMRDPEGLLVQQTGNVQSARQIRFAGLADILGLREALAAYVEEAIRVEKAGLKTPKQTPEETPAPEEWRARLAASPELAAAFAALTPGRRRAYLLFFGGAKQAKTRAARIDKCVALILAGKGLDDEGPPALTPARA